jgi:hypothetical protein
VRASRREQEANIAFAACEAGCLRILEFRAMRWPPFYVNSRPATRVTIPRGLLSHLYLGLLVLLLLQLGVGKLYSAATKSSFISGDRARLTGRPALTDLKD